VATNSRTAEERLAKLGISFPDAPTPFGPYVPAVQTGNLLFLSGMLATSGHTATVVGVVEDNKGVRTLFRQFVIHFIRASPRRKRALTS